MPIEKRFSKSGISDENKSLIPKAKKQIRKEDILIAKQFTSTEKNDTARTIRPDESAPGVQTEEPGREIKGEFYALPFAGLSEKPKEELQILRVELSRSALFALGLNLSLESEAQTVKTDLLIGSDGVTRAIRLVE